MISYFIMYIPNKYKQEDVATQMDFIRQQPFGILVSVGEDGKTLQATHIPFIVTEKGEGDEKSYVLKAHMARANKQYLDLDHETSRDPNKEYLLIFQGPNDYLSPSWYVETKPKTEKVVPTWIYSSVHLYGTVKVHKDSGWLLDQAGTLTDEREAGFEKKWKLADAPENYKLLKTKAIVGVEFTVLRSQAQWKFDQGHSRGDIDGVIEGYKSLGTENGDILAAQIEKANK